MKTESCEIRIRGMICRSCTDEVSGMLLRTKGVVKATVSYRKAMAAVSYDPALVTPDELERRIKSLGYETGERSRAERLLDLGCAALTVLLVWLLLRWGGASPEIGGASFGALFLVGLSTSPHMFKPSSATTSPNMVKSIDFMLSVYVSTVPKAPNTAPSTV